MICFLNTQPRLLAAAALLLSVTLLLCLASCKKEEAPEDPVKGIALVAGISVPQGVLDVAEVSVTVRTPYSLDVKTVDGPEWTYSFEVPSPSGTSPMPVHFDVSVKGKPVPKGDAIPAGLSYEIAFETVYGSGARTRIATFEKQISGRIIWISSTGQYGTLEPFNYAWRGEMKAAADSPAKYAVEALTL